LEGEHYYSVSGDYESVAGAISWFTCHQTEERQVMSHDQQLNENGDNDDELQLPVLPAQMIMIIVGLAIHADINNIRSCSLVSRL